METPLEVAVARCAMYEAALQMQQVAYDALLHHGVNFKTLPAFKRQTNLRKGLAEPPLRGLGKYVEWCRRMESEVKATVRRKGMHNVTD